MSGLTAGNAMSGTTSAFNFVLKVTVHSAEAPENKGYYASVDVDGKEKKTAVVKGRSVSWNETFCFNACNNSLVTTSLFREPQFNVSRFRGDILVGKIQTGLGRLVSNDGAMELELTAGSKISRVRISVLRGSDSDTTLELSHAIKNAAEIVGRMNGKEVKDLGLDPSSVESLLEEAWSPLMERISKFSQLADEVTKLSPYAKTAWEIISLAYKLFMAQVKRDMRIIGLLEKIWDAYEFVELANPLSVMKSLESLVQTLCAQTAECAYFIRRYASMASLSLRFLTNVGSDVDDAIDKYEKKFRELQECIVRRSTIQAALSVYRIEAKVEEIAMNIIYDRLRYQSGARYREHFEVKNPPPADAIGLLLRWANSTEEQTPRLFLFSCKDEKLSHQLSTEICKVLDKQHRLGSSFFCDLVPEFKDNLPDRLIPTISHDLADHDPIFKRNLYEATKDNRSLLEAKWPEDQFHALLLGPTAAPTIESDWRSRTRPTLIVINAFHFCGEPETRSDLFSAIIKLSHKLPPDFRLFVTMDATPDLTRFFLPEQGLNAPENASSLHGVAWFHRSTIEASLLSDSQFGVSTPHYDLLAAWSTLSSAPTSHSQMWCAATAVSLIDRFLLSNRSVQLARCTLESDAEPGYCSSLGPGFTEMLLGCGAVLKCLASGGGTTLSKLWACKVRECLLLLRICVENPGQDVEEIVERIHAVFGDKLAKCADIVDVVQEADVADNTSSEEIGTKLTMPLAPYLKEHCARLDTARHSSVFQTIEAWVKDMSEQSTRFLLFKGPPCSEKTSTIHALSKRYSEAGQLACAMYTHMGCVGTVPATCAPLTDALHSFRRDTFRGAERKADRLASPRAQLEEFLECLEILSKARTVRPVLFLLDDSDGVSTNSLLSQIRLALRPQSVTWNWVLVS